MSETVIEVDGLSKLYRLGEVGTGSLAHDVNRWWHRMRGLEDPYSKVGGVNDRSKKNETDWVWALKDINFTVQQGTVLGIIGRNGAGKSTLLKILSRVVAPTKGEVRVKGRIASLLEVGTGFHPDLTGRENIFLNGAILGMRRAEIDSKLDEIVEFSGCAAYLDTPVKRYSSGMQVRLAFAVAAHLDPEILIVDEVLAVGDAEFQKKCVGRMSEVAKEGRTVLFVSHNLDTIRTLTRAAFLFEQGRMVYSGNTADVLARYHDSGGIQEAVWRRSKETGAPLEVEKVYLSQGSEEGTNCLALSKSWSIHMTYEVREPLMNTVLEAWIHSTDGTLLCVIGDYKDNPEWLGSREAGRYELKIDIDHNFLNAGSYVMRVNACRGGVDVFAHFDALKFTVEVDTAGRHYNLGLGPISPQTRATMRKA